jgi:outer membrane protein assembly factor BamA
MRYRMAQVLASLLLTCCVGDLYLRAQVPGRATSPELQVEGNAICPPGSAPHPEAPPGPDISFAKVEFSGRLQLPVSEQQKIASGIKEDVHGYPLAGLVDEALERVKFGWRNHGYFDVYVSGDTTTLSSGPANERLLLRVEVNEGYLYRLGGITFKNNKAIHDVETLRHSFPLQDGDILSTEKIGNGLEQLRRTYGRLGYINFTPNPETRVDEQRRLIYIDIDMDEGRQFRIGSIEVVTADPALGRAFLEDFPMKAGDIYSSELWESILIKKYPLLPDCPCRWRTSKVVDDQAATVALSVDLRPCSGN